MKVVLIEKREVYVQCPDCGDETSHRVSHKDDTYAKNRVLKFYLEGEEILSATASLVTARPDSRGVRLVRISQELPYDLFVKVGAGKNVRIKLGPSEFGLSKDLLEALHDVKKSVGS
jgi:hypothetical protein